MLNQISKFDKILELRVFFEGAQLPKTGKLDACTTVLNVPAFIESHLNFCEGNIKSKVFDAYYERLVSFKKLIENNA